MWFKLPLLLLPLLTSSTSVRGDDNLGCELPRYCQNGEFLPDRDNCHWYWMCSNSYWHHMTCGNVTYFEHEVYVCVTTDYHCLGPCPTEEPYTGPPYTGPTEEPPSTGPCPAHVEECETGSYESNKYPDHLLCHLYYICSSGSLGDPIECPAGLVFNATSEECTYYSPEIDCYDRCPPVYTGQTSEGTTQGVPFTSAGESGTTKAEVSITSSTGTTTTSPVHQSTTPKKVEDDGGGSSTAIIAGICVGLILLIIIIIIIVIWRVRRSKSPGSEADSLVDSSSDDGGNKQKEPLPITGTQDGYLSANPSQLQTNLLFRTMYLPGSETDSKAMATTTMPSLLSGAPPVGFVTDPGPGLDNPAHGDGGNPQKAKETFTAMFADDAEVKLSIPESGAVSVAKEAVKDLGVIEEGDEEEDVVSNASQSQDNEVSFSELGEGTTFSAAL